jgi:signal peptidase I
LTSVRQARTARRSRSLLVESAVLIVVAAVIALVLRAFVAQAFSIPSASMSPQLLVGDRVVVSKLAYQLHDPNRGDIVVFDCPPGAGCLDRDDDSSVVIRGLRGLAEAVGLRAPSTEEYIKRVVALPGETVEGRAGEVFVDGRRLVEPHLSASATTSDFGPEEVGEDELWVLGDNRTNSSDSRVFGPIEQETVVGRATHRAWPPTRTAFL